MIISSLDSALGSHERGRQRSGQSSSIPKKQKVGQFKFCCHFCLPNLTESSEQQALTPTLTVAIAIEH